MHDIANKYPPKDIMPTILDIDGILGYTSIDFSIEEGFDEYPDLPEVTPGSTIYYIGESNIYINSEILFIKAVDKYVHKMTAYVTLNGFIYLPFDYDELSNITNLRRIPENNIGLKSFMSHINGLFSDELTLLLIRNLI